MLGEFVYQLKIPPITDFISNIDQYKIKKKGTTEYSADILNPEYKNWMGLEWNAVSFFYKSNGYRPPVAHVDKYYHERPTYNRTWGINFHIDGSGLFELFRYEDVTPIEGAMYKDSMDYKINENAVKSYFMEEGAYLVFNQLPHVVTGYQERFCISLRCTSMCNQPPEEIFNIFKDYIIDKPLPTKAPIDCL